MTRARSGVVSTAHAEGKAKGKAEGQAEAEATSTKDEVTAEAATTTYKKVTTAWPRKRSSAEAGLRINKPTEKQK